MTTMEPEAYQAFDEVVRVKAKEIMRIRFRNANREHPLMERLLRNSFSDLLCALSADIDAVAVPCLATDRPEKGSEQPLPAPCGGITSAEEILKQKINLASLPQLVVELQEAISSPTAGAGDIARIISNDVKLTASILRLVNSPLYGLVTPVETVPRAVAIVGVHQLTSLAIGTTLISSLSRRLKRLSLESFWLHSIACASIARKLAQALGLANPERFFVSGLLHDLGYLFLLGAYPEAVDIVMSTAQKEGRFLHDVEQQKFGFCHGEIGGLILRRWNLSEATVAAARWHHEPDIVTGVPDDGGEQGEFAQNRGALHGGMGRHAEAAGDTAQVTQGIDQHVVHVADVMAKALGYHVQNDVFVPPVSVVSWDMLGVPMEVLDEIITGLHDEIGCVARILLPE